MQTMIVCVSVSNGNTRRVADRMADVLGATVAEPEDVDLDELAACDLVGFGSGIYLMQPHRRLRSLIARLPRVDQRPAFVFATSGSPRLPILDYLWPTVRALRSKGFEVVDTFSCLGLDTVGPLGLVGGINRGRPNERDLAAAERFARQLGERVAV
ncbi:MAG: flavodoxin family protein [Acidimicrobiales bacterium]